MDVAVEADTSDAHDASAISIVDAGGHYVSTDVEGALGEISGTVTATAASTPPGIFATEGEEGAPGAPGRDGAPGVAGPPGVTGVPGDDGDPGFFIPGDRGPTGPAGEGVFGQQGEDGDPGFFVPGDRGPTGPAGEGVPGPAGEDGDAGLYVPPDRTTDTGTAIYGDGSDGAIQFSVGGATVAGATRVGTTYTMQRNIYATDIVVDTTITLVTNGYGLFGRGTLTNNGAVSWDGNAAVTVTGGTALDTLSVSMQPYFGSVGTGASAADAPGAGTKNTSGYGGAGGAGGTNSAGTAGSAGGGTPTDQVAGGIPRDAVRAITGYGIAGNGDVFTYTKPLNYGIHMWGGGSGGGAAASVTLGGSGGSGGGHVVIACRFVINNGTITATGGAGSAGTTASNLGGGGGGGGGGGLVIVIYDTYTGAAATAAGGARGNSQGYRSTPVVDGTIDDNTNGATFATGSISPTNGAMYLICVVNRRGGSLPTTPTVAGTNGWNTTWTQVVTGTFGFGGGANTKRMTIFRGVASSGTAGVVTISHGGTNQTSEQAIILRMPLVDTTTNQGVVQAPVVASGTGTTFTATALSAFASRFNPGVAFYSDSDTVANITVETPWVELTELNTATEQGSTAVHYLRYADLSPTATGTSGDWGAWATELATTTTEDSVAGTAGKVVTIPNI